MYQITNRSDTPYIASPKFSWDEIYTKSFKIGFSHFLLHELGRYQTKSKLKYGVTKYSLLFFHGVKFCYKICENFVLQNFSHNLLLIKFLSDQVVVMKPYLIQTQVNT